MPVDTAPAPLVWQPVLTDAGRTAIQTADGLGLSAKITHVALGTGSYRVRNADGTPTAAALTARALQQETLRVPVHAGGSPEPGTLLILAQVPRALTPAEEFWISEIGFYDAGGTLLVVWSGGDERMGYRGPLGDWNLQLSWSWTDLPTDAVTVQVLDPALSEQLLRQSRLRAQVAYAVTTAGLSYADPDETALARAIDARIKTMAEALDPQVRRPVAISPANGISGVILAPLLAGSPYVSLWGYQQTGSQWLITDANGTLVHDSGLTAPATTYQAPVLERMSGFRWQVRYQGTLADKTVWSQWSDPATFSTAERYIPAPSILAPATGTGDIDAHPTLTSSSFTVIGGTDTHVKSQWRLKDASGTVVWDSGETTALVQVTIPDGVLAVSKTYTAEVRHIGAQYGASNWSTGSEFTTRAVFSYIQQPVISLPAAGATQVAILPTIYGSAFSAFGTTDTHAKTQVQVKLAASDWGTLLHDSGELGAVTTYTLPSALPHAATVTARIRYKGAALGWSNWRDVSFTTVPAVTYWKYEGGFYTWVAPLSGQYAVVVRGGNGGTGYIGGGDDNPFYPGPNGGSSSFGGYLSAAGGLGQQLINTQPSQGQEARGIFSLTAGQAIAVTSGGGAGSIVTIQYAG